MDRATFTKELKRLTDIRNRNMGSKAKVTRSQAAPEPRMVTYFVQRARGGPIKIGRSVHVGRRLIALRTGTHERLVILATIDGDHEARLHQLLARHRLRGEWFSPHPEVLAAVAAAKCDADVARNSGVTP
jgi:hypothetical protein